MIEYERRRAKGQMIRAPVPAQVWKPNPVSRATGAGNTAKVLPDCSRARSNPAYGQAAIRFVEARQHFMGADDIAEGASSCRRCGPAAMA